METNSDRRRRKLAALCEERGLRAIAERAKLNPASLDQIIKGTLLPPKKDGSRSSRKLGDEATQKIEDAEELGRGWFDLPDAEGPVAASGSAVSVALGPAPAPGEPAIHVPLLSNAGSMGQGHDALHDDVLVGHIALSPQWVTKRLQPTSPKALKFIHAYGDSMTPTFADGDILLVDTGARDPSHADGVYVLATNQRLFIKRVTGRFDGGYDVTSDNSTVKTIGSLSGEHSIDVLGRVVWAWNGKKL